MWKLNEIYAQNICAFKELKYTINQDVTTLIFGDNKDNESQRSNGAGKSALIECIALGITGSTLRNIKKEEIINDYADEAFIELQFANTSCNETFVIERRLRRKGTSEVATYIFRDQEFAADEGIQPSIEAYNKFILEKLGISKDELYNNFILSKYKYQDFLSCSDKDKKEIINRFSNGNLVDEALERIQADKSPYEASLKKKELELASIEGHISALSEQIEKEKLKAEEKVRTKKEKITDIKQSIIAKRSQISLKQADLKICKAEKETINSIDKQLQVLENSNKSIEECVGIISDKLAPYDNSKSKTNWLSVLENKKKEIILAENDLKRLDESYKKSDAKVKQLVELYKQSNDELDAVRHKNSAQNKANETKLVELKDNINRIIERSTIINKQKRNLSSSIEDLKNMLAGTISCPSCGFEFLASDKSFNTVAARKQKQTFEVNLENLSIKLKVNDSRIESLEQQESTIQKEKQELKYQDEQLTLRLSEIQQNYQKALLEKDKFTRLQNYVKETIETLHNEINNMRRKVFDEAYEIIDTVYKAIVRKANAANEDIQTFESSIETLEVTIKELDNISVNDLSLSLKSSMREWQDKESKVLGSISLIEKELLRLEEQEQHFNHFKTYLANTKIEALSKITNEFLEDIGSDIRIKFSGYTVLKTGKIREKISVSLIRSGLDCGSFGKFSAGEAARVNLATILSMQKLINANCDDDKGLDLLVLDEILEAVDEDGLACMFSSLNRIRVTTLVVSHGNIAESYPYKVKIVKEHGISKIEG